MQLRFYLKNNKSAYNMNSNSQDVASDLLGRGQPYDDTFLRKRVTCIGSGLLLCFIIGGAGLGISIIILMKFEGSAGVFPQYAANQTEHMKALKDQMKQLQKQVETLNNEVSNLRKPDYLNLVDADPLDIDSPGPDSFGKNVAPIKEDHNISELTNQDFEHEHPPAGLDTSTMNPDELLHHHHHHHHHHNGLEQNSYDKGGPNLEHDQDPTSTIRKPDYPNIGDADPLDIDSSGPDSFGKNVAPIKEDHNISGVTKQDVDHEHPSADLDTSTMNHDDLLHHHHNHNGLEQNSYDKGGPPLEHDQHPTSTSHDHPSHQLHSSPDLHGSVVRSEAGTPSINELLCDDSDQCPPSAEAGSGLFDGSGEYFSDDGSMAINDFSEGSGDCIQFPRPVCPNNFKVCYTDDPCPIPICCYSN